MSGKGGSKLGVLGGQLGFLIRGMEDWVIPDVMNDVFYPKEHTLKIMCCYLNWKCVRMGVKKGVLGGS